MKQISFILPIYNEKENIEKLFSEILKIKNCIDEDIEIIFIDDGSSDGSTELLKNICQSHPFVKLIIFSRNFGHQIAITSGLDFASGDAVIIMDSDLQDPPEVALDLIKKWKEGYEVVYAKRRTRKDTLFKKTTANLFYKLLNVLSDIKIPENTGDFRLMDKKVVEEMKKCKEKSRFMRGLTSFIGFKQTSVLFDRNKRFKGKTHYSIKKMVKFALDGIVGFSMTPLRIISYFGFFIIFLSFLGIVYTLFMKFFSLKTAVSAWTLVIMAIFFIGGVQMIMLGIIGEYIGRIYKETQNRPLYIIKDKINFSENNENIWTQKI